MEQSTSFIQGLGVKQLIFLVSGFFVFFGGMFLVEIKLKYVLGDKKSALIKFMIVLVCILLVVIGFN